jgi:hypothetical protein
VRRFNATSGVPPELEAWNLTAVLPDAKAPSLVRLGFTFLWIATLYEASMHDVFRLLFTVLKTANTLMLWAGPG